MLHICAIVLVSQKKTGVSQKSTYKRAQKMHLLTGGKWSKKFYLALCVHQLTEPQGLREKTVSDLKKKSGQWSRVEMV